MSSTLGGIKKYINSKGGLFAKGTIDIKLFAFVLLMLVIGLVMLLSATYPYAYYYEDDSMLYFRKQCIGAVIGFVFMLFISKLNFNLFREIGAVLGTIVSFALLLIALVMPEYHGTHRYIYIGSFQFQPSDVAKFALILTLACLLDKYHHAVLSKKPLQAQVFVKLNTLAGRPIFNYSIKMIAVCGIIIVLYTGLVIAGSHLSGAILMMCIGISLLYLGEIRGKWFVAGIIGGILLIVIAYESGILKGYMEERITAWLDKDYDPLGARWQTNQALYAIGSGGLLGKGLGNSTLKYLYVSEPQNDMIFSIVVEELGFIGAALIIILFALIVWRGVVIGVNAQNRYGALIAMGVVFQLAVQVILNIAVATDSIPNTGISLPFFSYGRTALIMMLIEFGFVLSVSRTSKIRRR